MKILISSHTFFPSVGGLEAVSMMLAQKFTQAGHEVIVITSTPHGNTSLELPFKVVRQPSLVSLVRLINWSDLVLHSHISLRTAWPLIFISRPWVVVHHSLIPRSGVVLGAIGRIKHFLLRWATNISVSEAIAKDIKEPVTVIPNPYDEGTFRLLSEVERNRDLIFVGRFVAYKGLPVLLHALTILREKGLKPNLTVVGSGKEEDNWRDMTERLKLSSQVKFVGVKIGEELVKELNAHRIMVVPSIDEPFGIVALEGQACGCVVVGSESGGLPEAIGAGGLTFPNADSNALAEILSDLLCNQEKCSDLQLSSKSHLQQHHQKKVAEDYLKIIEKSCQPVSRNFYAKNN